MLSRHSQRDSSGRSWQLARIVPLPPGPVMAQDSEGFMPRPLPALGTTGLIARHFDVATAGGCGCLALTWPPGDQDRARLPLMAEAALLREAGPRLPSCLPHAVYSTYDRIAQQGDRAMRTITLCKCKASGWAALRSPAVSPGR